MKGHPILKGCVLAGVLLLAACGGGSGSGNTSSGGQTITVGTDTGANLKFDPTTVEAPANTDIQLVFDNKSTTQPHNLVFQGDITAKTSTLVMPGKSETLSFKTPAAGTYNFVCTIHPGMTGQLVVK